MEQRKLGTKELVVSARKLGLTPLERAGNGLFIGVEELAEIAGTLHKGAVGNERYPVDSITAIYR